MEGGLYCWGDGGANGATGSSSQGIVIHPRMCTVPGTSQEKNKILTIAAGRYHALTLIQDRGSRRRTYLRMFV